MSLPPGLRRAALAAHVTVSVGWSGAVLVFLALAVTALTSREADVTRAGHLAVDLAARFVIVPLALASLLTGLVSSLGSPWGLVRHYWVLVKLALTLVATVVLLLQLANIRQLADARATAAADDALRQAGTSMVVHSAGGLLVLLGATVLAVYKPRGATRYGHRRQERATAP